jgi:hypothetical protein
MRPRVDTSDRQLGDYGVAQATQLDVQAYIGKLLYNERTGWWSRGATGGRRGG